MYRKPGVFKYIFRSKDIERIMELMEAMTDTTLPKKSRDELQKWFESPIHIDQKNNTMASMICDVLQSNEPIGKIKNISEQERIRFTQLATKLGWEPELIASVLPKRRVVIIEKTWFKIAAIIIPFAIIMTALWVWDGGKTKGYDMGYNYDWQTITATTDNSDHVDDLKLPDGSVIQVTNGSRVRMRSNFANQREVSLEGEARFRVKNSENSPFVVETKQFKIKVLGTEFSVMAFPNSDTMCVTLYSGSVEVYNDKYRNVIEPGYRLTYIKSEDMVTITKIETAISDAPEVIYIKDQTVDDIIPQIAQYYGFTIEKKRNDRIN